LDYVFIVSKKVTLIYLITRRRKNRRWNKLCEREM